MSGMQIHAGFDLLPSIPNPVITTGTFDGVHIGHQAIIRRLLNLAEQVGGETVLISFHPHPRKVLFPDTAGKDLKLICSQKEKIRLLEKAGLHHLIIIPFSKEFAAISSQEFVQEFLVRKLHAKIVIIGFNHHFGHNREGDFSYLYQLSRVHGFEVEEIPEQDIHHETVSSTRIRKALLEGNIQRANASLDHFFMMSGLVVPSTHTHSSDHPGLFGLSVEEEVKLFPASGVYAVKVEVGAQMHKGIVMISANPTCKPADGHSSCLEFCLTDEAISLPYSEVCIFFHKRLDDLPADNPTKAIFDKYFREIRELIY